MPFRNDIDLANTWVVSDTHFGHNNIIGFCHRPSNHEDVMVSQWRKHVPDDATLLHLGDLTYRDNALFKHMIAPQLTGGRKILILGNHDKQKYSFYRGCGFEQVKPFSIGVTAGRNKIEAAETLPQYAKPRADWYISFSHYPWSEKSEGPMGFKDVRLHGHIHNNGYTRNGYVPFLKNHINLGVEQIKYRPVNLKELLEGYLLGVYRP